MCLGNGFGFAFADGVSKETLFKKHPVCFLVEAAGDALSEGTLLGRVSDAPELSLHCARIPLAELETIYEGKLEPVFACNIPMEKKSAPCAPLHGRFMAAAVPAHGCGTRAHPRVSGHELRI